MNKRLYDFIEEHTCKFDKLHDIHHSIKVYDNSIKAIKMQNIFFEEDIITWASLLYDAYDYNKNTRNNMDMYKISSFIENNLGSFKANRIYNIIYRVYCKQTINDYDKLYIDIILNSLKMCDN